MYCGGTSFVHHTNSLIYIEHQVSLSMMDTLVVKHSFECMAMMNVVVTSRELNKHVLDLELGFAYSGLDTHHQSGVAERAI